MHARGSPCPSFLIGYIPSIIIINRPESLILVTSRKESLTHREEEEETRSTQRENKKMAAELSIEVSLEKIYTYSCLAFEENSAS